MDKMSILLKLCYKFSTKYMKQYLLALKKPAIAAVLGVILFATCLTQDPIFVVVALLSIPCFCYAFWRGYVITYALIPCANDFIKDSPKPFETYVLKAKNIEGELAWYLCFALFLTLILYIPSVAFILKTLSLSDILSNPVHFINTAMQPLIINTIILAPFLNFFLCVFNYKKEKENYFTLFLNCYKKLDILGIFIAVVITLIGFIGGTLYLLFALFLNPFIYSINTFWYLSRTEKKV